MKKWNWKKALIVLTALVVVAGPHGCRATAQAQTVEPAAVLGGDMPKDEFLQTFNNLAETVEGTIVLDKTYWTIEDFTLTFTMPEPGKVIIGLNGVGCHWDNLLQGIFLEVDGELIDVSEPNAFCAWFGVVYGREIKVISRNGQYHDAESITYLRVVGKTTSTPNTPTPTATPSATPTATSTVTNTTTATATPTATASQTPEITSSPTPTSTLDLDTPTPVDTPTPGVTPPVTQTLTPTPQATGAVYLPAVEVGPSVTPTPTPTSTPTPEMEPWLGVAFHQDPHVESKGPFNPSWVPEWLTFESDQSANSGWGTGVQSAWEFGERVVAVQIDKVENSLTSELVSKVLLGNQDKTPTEFGKVVELVRQRDLVVFIQLDLCPGNVPCLNGQVYWRKSLKATGLLPAWYEKHPPVDPKTH